MACTIGITVGEASEPTMGLTHRVWLREPLVEREGLFELIAGGGVVGLFLGDVAEAQDAVGFA